MSTPAVPEHAEYEVDGVRVETYGSPTTHRPSLLFVHGGIQGSWTWENIAPRMADQGWHSVCLNWYNHNGSRSLPEDEAVRRSIADVTLEIGLVANTLDRAPVLVAHSMGGMAATIYATTEEVAALVLLTPVVPKKFAGAAIDIEVDRDELWLPPQGMVDGMFWNKVDHETAIRYEGLLSPESPRAVLEGTRWLLDPDISTIKAPAYLFGGGADHMVPADYVESLANALRARYTLLPGEGHGVPQNPVSARVATEVDEWLAGHFPLT